ncbi:MAG: hypothetical protein H6734_28430 [Alphaproteobacteria bacterium]|nr:hypothetical protein [Alphaproteobacteria bacterium]MCB9688317.1 hypothetical protein [Alphaproteobacteria bacterium]
MHLALLVALLPSAHALEESDDDAPCTVAGATLTRDKQVWSFDEKRFDLSNREEREAFAHTIQPCTNVETWKGFVDWRSSRTLTRTIGWTAASTVWTLYGPMVLGTITVVEAGAVVPEKKRWFQQALQRDLEGGEIAVPTPEVMVEWDLASLEVQRTRHQWEVPVAVGGSLLAVVGTGVVLFYAFPPDLGGLGG